MKRLLLDLNVFLDVILDRPPDANLAAASVEVRAFTALYLRVKIS